MVLRVAPLNTLHCNLLHSHTFSGPLFALLFRSKKHARILSADDDERIRTGVSRYLHLNGYPVENAADGAKALEKIIAAQHTIHSYDLLICDLDMPRLFGKDLLRTLNEKGDALVVIVISGTDDIKKVYYRHLCRKPFTPEHLMRCVTSALPYYRSKHTMKPCNPFTETTSDTG